MAWEYHRKRCSSRASDESGPSSVRWLMWNGGVQGPIRCCAPPSFMYTFGSAATCANEMGPT